LTIGSEAGVELRIADLAVSARHCRLGHRGDHLAVVDLGSESGIRLVGAQVREARLPLEAAFEVGRTTVRVRPVAGHQVESECCLPGMIGTASCMRELGAVVRRAAELEVSVLLRGDTGTGKELVAKALHRLGPRADRPLVVINGATLSTELAGSELFGHERGAFTGAVSMRRGAFRAAHGGTLFIDELASLPRPVQAKLLRATEEGTITPVGADEPVAVDVRLVVATCEPLEELVRYGSFRSDLYHRLAACVLRVPPLRERPEDIAPLVHHLLGTIDVGPVVIAEGVMEQLRKYEWPGNVRELRNVLVRAAVRSEGGELRPEVVASVLVEQAPVRRRPSLGPQHAVRLVRESGGNVSLAARKARMPRSTFRDLLRAAES